MTLDFELHRCRLSVWRRRLEAVASGAVLTVLAVLACGCVSCNSGGAAAAFDESIAAVGLAINEGAYPDAARLIERTIGVTRGRVGWLSLLKRAHAVGKATGDFELMRTVAEQAHRELPGAEDVAGLLAFASLRTGNHRRAYRIAREYLKSEAWKTIAQEAYVAARAVEASEEAGVGGRLADLFRSDDPGLYRDAARSMDEWRLAFDAALLYMRRGDANEAAGLIPEFVAKEPYAAALMAYDAGEAGEAAELIRRAGNGSVDQELIMADMLYSAGRVDEAAAVAAERVSVSPDDHWIPFANVSFVLRERGDRHELLLMTRNGAHVHPDSDVLAALYAFSLAEGGEAGEALRVLQRRIDQGSASPRIAYAYSLISNSEKSELRAESVLWSSYLERPYDRELALLLGDFLFRRKDAVQLVELAETYELNVEDTDWTHMYRGIGLAATGDTKEAEAEFIASAALRPCWQAYYNASLTAEARGDYDGAADFLVVAEALSRANGRPVPLIWVALSRVHRSAGNTDAAVRAARYAIDLDPTLNDARLLLRILEDPARDE